MLDNAAASSKVEPETDASLGGGYRSPQLLEGLQDGFLAVFGLGGRPTATQASIHAVYYIMMRLCKELAHSHYYLGLFGSGCHFLAEAVKCGISMPSRLSLPLPH